MGIYINGIEMPKSKSICIIIDPAGQVRHYDLNNDKYADNELFEAVSISPHGRLIDADVLAEKHRELAYELRGANYDFHMTACSWVNSAPTIIPAEEGK